MRRLNLLHSCSQYLLPNARGEKKSTSELVLTVNNKNKKHCFPMQSQERRRSSRVDPHLHTKRNWNKLKRGDEDEKREKTKKKTIQKRDYVKQTPTYNMLNPHPRGILASLVILLQIWNYAYKMYFGFIFCFFFLSQNRTVNAALFIMT